MDSNRQVKNKIAVNIPIFLFLLFLTLKLAKIGEVATWSWWWVTSPIWLPPVIAIALFFMLFIFAYLIS